MSFSSRPLFYAAALLVFGLQGDQTCNAGSLVAWGYNTSGETIVPSGNNFVAISAGLGSNMSHSLALTSDGSLAGWGYNFSGQANVPSGNNFVAIDGGSYHSLALRSSGSLAAWGSNAFGQLNAPSGNDFIAIATGGKHSLALKSDGSLAAWGSNEFGQTTVPSGNNFTAIAAGYGHSLALKSDGSLAAWGPTAQGISNPPSGNNFVAIAAGWYFSLALRSDGSLVHWGDPGEFLSPVANVPAGNSFVAISAGAVHGLALKSDGSLAAWGSNEFGQTTVPSGNNFTAIDAGAYHNLAIRSAEPTLVNLAFGTDAPFRLETQNVPILGDITSLNRALKTPAAEVPNQEALRARVQEIFEEGGVNVEVVTGNANASTTVYFGANYPGLLGRAVTGVDRRNQRDGDQAIVYTEGLSTRDLATVIAHEVGHTFGLRHIEGPSEVMDRQLQLLELFTWEPKTVDDKRSLYTHNPRYHLERWVGNRSKAELAGEDLFPGSWDEGVFELISQFDFGSANFELYDVQIFMGEEDVSEGTWTSISENADEAVSLSDFSKINFSTLRGETFSMFASSTAGGPSDVILATGDPFDDGATEIALEPGRLPVFLQLLQGPDQFTTIATGTLATVPEPSAAIIITSLVLCAAGSLRWQRST